MGAGASKTLGASAGKRKRVAASLSGSMSCAASQSSEGRPCQLQPRARRKPKSLKRLSGARALLANAILKRKTPWSPSAPPPPVSSEESASPEAANAPQAETPAASSSEESADGALAGLGDAPASLGRGSTGGAVDATRILDDGSAVSVVSAEKRPPRRLSETSESKNG